MSRSDGFVTLLVVSVLAACGGDEPTPKQSDGPKLGAAGNGSPPGAFTCGAVTCKLPESREGFELCCKDPFEGECGVLGGGTCMPFPPEVQADERCMAPPVTFLDVPGLRPKKVGCCTADNKCGIDYGNNICGPLEFACRLIPPSEVPKLKLTTCDGTPLPLPVDCGATVQPFAGSGG